MIRIGISDEEPLRPVDAGARHFNPSSRGSEPVCRGGSTLEPRLDRHAAESIQPRFDRVGIRIAARTLHAPVVELTNHAELARGRVHAYPFDFVGARPENLVV